MGPKASTVGASAATPMPCAMCREQAPSKHEPWEYAMYNAPYVALAGAVAGFQEAYYKFEVGPCGARSEQLRRARRRRGHGC